MTIIPWVEKRLSRGKDGSNELNIGGTLTVRAMYFSIG
jgi:hypothetical protein